MVKILIALLIFVLMIALDVYQTNTGDSPSKPVPTSQSQSDPSAAIEKAQNQLQQTQSTESQLNAQVKKAN